MITSILIFIIILLFYIICCVLCFTKINLQEEKKKNKELESINSYLRERLEKIDNILDDIP